MSDHELERQLERATAHANVLLDRAIGGPATAEHEARLRAEALALWEEGTLPSAMFETVAREATHANAAWRRLFETRPVPEPLYDAVASVRATAELRHLPEMSLGLVPTPSFCALTLRPRFGVPETIIVVCSAITDEVIARHLEVPATALVWSAPIAGGPLWTSSAWLSYCGPQNDDWKLVIHPEDLARCLHAFQEASRQRVSSDVEVRVRREDGSYRWHRVWFTMDLFGRWFGAATENREQYTTEDERAQLLAQAHAARADAEQASRLKDQFLAAVSHELRAPMTTMLLWEKVLRDETAELGVRTQALAAIHESAVAQSRLVADLLDVSRAISGKLFVDRRSHGVPRPHGLGVRANAEHADRRASPRLGCRDERGARARHHGHRLVAHEHRCTNDDSRVRIGRADARRRRRAARRRRSTRTRRAQVAPRSRRCGRGHGDLRGRRAHAAPGPISGGDRV